ncbi:sulfatase [Shewanella sp. D64]|uniref:sulfatase n=1 Tax=unclassified Shewanella TaxID=196818 RepID=UPI0022BA6E4B|nr:MULTISPECIES: sulfatase [unclassified Shewanella]MEC4725504.1 sulfatase [Shewanella sp. D64]MEC4738677.1 sulfatase [Shewanella sp. E94]WBJ94974.1 sulfatase [Shewanella sp. MTB7]
MIKKFHFLYMLLACNIAFASDDDQTLLKPNVIIFYVDDLGWQDSQLNDIDKPTPWETPNMLKLADQGMNFTQAYSSAPTCAPSRAGLLSGQHPAKIELTHVLGARIPRSKSHSKLIAPYINDHLSQDTLTIASALQNNGYKTGHSGKWHLGDYRENGPLTVGFDFSYGGRGAHRSAKDRSTDFSGNTPTEKYPLSIEKYAPFSDKYPEGISYPYDEVTENALSFIDDNKDEPFFLYLAHWLVHFPTVTKNRELLEYYTDKLGIPFPTDPSSITTEGQTNPYYGAMVTTVDWSLGKLISYLEKTDDPRNPGKKLIETTYVFLSSDNGGAEKHSQEIITDNAPLDMGKKHAQEGGIRVPMVVSGPTIKAGTQYHGLVNQLDYFPTIMHLSQASIDKGDEEKLSGLDISNVLSDENQTIVDKQGNPRENLFWHFPHNTDHQMQSALREGDFKLYKNHLDNSFELYRLYQNGNRADLEEKHDLASVPKHQARLAKLTEKLESHLELNNAVLPYLNPLYQGELEGKSDIPRIVSNTFNPETRVATIQLKGGRAEVKEAYLLVRIADPKVYQDGDVTRVGKVVVTYKKLPARINSNQLIIRATVPRKYERYLFVLIDENNFLRKTPLTLTTVE